MSDDKKTSEEGLGQDKAAEAQKAENEKNPFGPHIKPAMYIIYNEELNSFGVIGAPGFLDDSVRAYGALKMAEKNLDEFYAKKNSIRNKLMAGVHNFQNKMNFRRFMRFGK